MATDETATRLSNNPTRHRLHVSRLIARNLTRVREFLDERSRSSALAEWLLLRLRWRLARFRGRTSDVDYAKQSFAHAGQRLDLNNPSTFNEKLWFLKLSNRDPLLTECSDKHRVRDYVARVGLAHILKDEYGAYAASSAIDFSTLPSPAYLKCNHGSGLNWVYRKNVSRKELRRRMRSFDFILKQNPYWLSREWNYKNIEPRIVAEEVLTTEDGSDVPELQFFCFHGEVKFIMYNLGLADSEGRHTRAARWVFDPEFNLVDVTTSMEPGENVPERPENFDSMLDYAARLAKPFPHVRVDLFNVGGRIVFNELTFYSGGGFVKLEPHDWQYRVGSWIDVSGMAIAPDAYERLVRRSVALRVQNLPIGCAVRHWSRTI